MARAFEEHVEGILERGVVAAAELVMVGGILAAAGGEVGVGNEPGPEAALVGREGGVGDVPGEGAGRTSGEVAPEDVLGGAWQRATGEVLGASWAAWQPGVALPDCCGALSGLTNRCLRRVEVR